MGSSIAQFSGNILNGKKSLLDKNKLVKNANLLLMKKNPVMITVYVCAVRVQTAVSPIKKEGASENLINFWSFKMSDFMGSFWTNLPTICLTISTILCLIFIIHRILFQFIV